MPLAHQLGAFDVAEVARAEEEAVDAGEEHNPAFPGLPFLIQELWDGEDVGIEVAHDDDVWEPGE